MIVIEIQRGSFSSATFLSKHIGQDDDDRPRCEQGASLGLFMEITQRKVEVFLW